MLTQDLDRAIDNLRRDNDAAMMRLGAIEAALIDLRQSVDQLRGQLDEMRPRPVDPRWLASMARRSMRWRGLRHG